jgi:hypothetical protein
MHLKINKKEVIRLKKIKKINPISAQSVYSFYCPCDGRCEVVCLCNISSKGKSNLINSLNENTPHRTTGV